MYCQACERELRKVEESYHQNNAWHITAQKIFDMPEEKRNKEIVRQLRLWQKELGDDPLIHTIDEILHGQYDEQQFPKEVKS